MADATWHGTDAERTEWEQAMTRNCDCQHDEATGGYTTCAVHLATRNDQRFMDHLVFAKRLWGKRGREEENA